MDPLIASILKWERRLAATGPQPAGVGRRRRRRPTERPDESPHPSIAQECVRQVQSEA
jgi:hypothetical protein